MTTDLFDQPTTEIPRDRWGRPLVTPPNGGKPVGYTRTTSYVGALEDTFNLERWKMRMVALGLSARDDLLLSVVAHHDDKNHLNKICDQAVEAAKASAAATTGTALHSLTEQHDRGTLDLARVPAAYRPDIEAYARAVAGIEILDIEGFGVLDDLQVGGTWDRIGRLPDGRTVVLDVKTGSIEWGLGKIAMQLACYARATPYNHVGAVRGRPNPEHVDQSAALIVHLPAGEGTCSLVEVDIKAGWEAVALATAVRDWRKRKNLSRPYAVAPARAPYQGHPAENRPPAADHVALLDGDVTRDHIALAISFATTAERLRGIWAANEAQWTPELTELAKARRALIEGGLA